MLRGSRLRASVGMLAAVTASLALAATAGASSSDPAVIQAQDACDPATFPDGLCQPHGSSGTTVTFDEANARLAKDHAIGAWRFHDDRIDVQAGQPVLVVHGRGGEVHTFTKVPQFGLGCVPDLNEAVFGTRDVNPQCATDPGIFTDDLVIPGLPVRQLPAAELTRGTNRFECMIHPWMHATVVVRS
jgi:hypothetical protein